MWYKAYINSELGQATSWHFCHTCLPFEIHIHKVKLWFISNHLRCIISNLSLIKAGNLSVLDTHIGISLQRMWKMNLVTRLYCYNLLAKDKCVFSLVKWLWSTSLFFPPLYNALTFAFKSTKLIMHTLWFSSVKNTFLCSQTNQADRTWRVKEKWENERRNALVS